MFGDGIAQNVLKFQVACAWQFTFSAQTKEHVASHREHRVRTSMPRAETARGTRIGWNLSVCHGPASEIYWRCRNRCQRSRRNQDDPDCQTLQLYGSAQVSGRIRLGLRKSRDKPQFVQRSKTH